MEEVLILYFLFCFLVMGVFVAPLVGAVVAPFVGAVVAPFVGTVVAPFVGAVEGFVDTAGADETSAVGDGVAKASLTTRAQSFPPDNLYVVPSISVFVPI